MRVCLVTAGRDGHDEKGLVAIKAAVRGGVSMVQIREKQRSARDLLSFTRRVLDAVRDAAPESGPPDVLVNGRLDVAWAAGAAGVHLPSTGIPPGPVRKLCPPPFLIGVSAHRPEELLEAREAGADYAIYGPIFPTASHPGAAGIGVEALRRAMTVEGLPIWAIGGINRETVPLLAGLPLAGVAVIRALLDAVDPEQVAVALAAG